MPKKRYINTREQSFFGNYIYDQTVPKNHFLRLLNQLIHWDRFTDQLIELYRGGGEYGRPPFNPVQILKMCLLAYFYNLSDRQVEVFVNENLPAKYFVGLGLDQQAPDHSTLTIFRKRLIKQGNLKVFEQLLAEIIQIAITAGISLAVFRSSIAFIVRLMSTQPKTNNVKTRGKGRMIQMQNGGSKGNTKPPINKGRMSTRSNTSLDTKGTSA